MAKLKFNKKNWNATVRKIIDTDGVARMQRVADACNQGLETDKAPGYRVSTEGDEPLSKRGYRATVITAEAESIVDNAENNTLVRNLHLAGGD